MTPAARVHPSLASKRDRGEIHIVGSSILARLHCTATEASSVWFMERGGGYNIGSIQVTYRFHAGRIYRYYLGVDVRVEFMYFICKITKHKVLRLLYLQ